MLKGIKFKRLNQGFTQSEIAKLLGISLNSYNKKENGISKWSLDEANKLKSVFDLTKDEIVSYFFN